MSATGVITLTEDQQKAMNAFQQFLLDPTETVFVLSGYSGCGKSTLVRTLLDKLPAFMKTVRLINPSQKDYEVALTATTNKAAENLARITGSSATTIHSFLSLRVNTDYKTGVTTLTPRNWNPVESYLLFIDEASYIDSKLLELIFKLTHKCKIVFVGDPAQLTPVKSSATPVFGANFNGAALTQVVRQAEGNPIVDLSTKFRHTVNTGEFFSFKPDGHHIQHLNEMDFHQAIINEFARPDWSYADSKILAWTNKKVIAYNQFVRNQVKGSPDFHVGDYAVCNSYIQIGKTSIKTDELVEITDIAGWTEMYGVKGRFFELNGNTNVFFPRSLEEANARVKKAKAEGNFSLVATIENTWIDLRAAYANTINKSQGSTYGKVFIDLDDVSKVPSGDTLARLLYVAVSRAKSYVYLTGDIHKPK